MLRLLSQELPIRGSTDSSRCEAPGCDWLVSAVNGARSDATGIFRDAITVAVRAQNVLTGKVQGSKNFRERMF